ncbi:MAG: PLP-dependent cysteine synthase family protein [Spirochaetia bacterium]
MSKDLFRDITESIGNTPMVELSSVVEERDLHLYGKMEFLNPGGSVKDRIALRIVQDAYETGDLQEGQPVVEMTSGNTGAGLAVVCNTLGNPFIAFISEGNSTKRAAMLRALGTDVRLVPQEDGQPGQVTGKDIEAAAEQAERHARHIGGFYVDQFNREGGVKAHEEGTGPEIWEALGGEIDGFVSVVGSAGTFIGTSKHLKRKSPHVVCAAVEPEGAEVLKRGRVEKPTHLLQGAGYGFVPPKWDASLADHIISVQDEETLEMKDDLARIEGVFVGFTAAANVVASIKLYDMGFLRKGAKVATILCDTGYKYLE